MHAKCITCFIHVQPLLGLKIISKYEIIPQLLDSGIICEAK